MLSVMTRPLNTEEKKGLMKTFRECITHKGASDKGISKVTTDFRTKLVNILDFEEMVMDMQDIVLKKLKQLQEASEFDLYSGKEIGKNAKRSREAEFLRVWIRIDLAQAQRSIPSQVRAIALLPSLQLRSVAGVVAGT